MATPDYRYHIVGGFDAETPSELICSETRKADAIKTAEGFLCEHGYSVVEVFDSMGRKDRSRVVWRGTFQNGAGEAV